MNILAIDIGNTNITAGLFLDDKEDFIESVPGSDEAKLAKLITSAWKKIPLSRADAEKKKDACIVVSSVKPAWTEMLEKICRRELDEKIKLIGKDIPLPIETSVDDSLQVGTDRLVNAAAAFAVVEDAVVVADFGTAVTIDLVDETGLFIGGTISPGFELSAVALHKGTAKLPMVTVTCPKSPFGSNTAEAITAGLFYSAVGLLETITRKYAEQLGRWPHVIVTGGAAHLLKQSCEFVDSWVPNLVVKGIVLAYKKYLDDRHLTDELDRPSPKKTRKRK